VRVWPARLGLACRPGEAWRCAAWGGRARHGRQGEVRQAQAGRGVARQAWCGWQGWAERGTARPGRARKGQDEHSGQQEGEETVSKREARFLLACLVAVLRRASGTVVIAEEDIERAYRAIDEITWRRDPPTRTLRLSVPVESRWSNEQA
jgi:hypothetical protein